MKISRAIGVLNFLKHTFPIHILKTIYNTLILSQLNYCLLSWGANSGVVFGLQKKAMRVMTCNHFKAHTDPIFKTLCTAVETTRFVQIKNHNLIL